LVVGQGANETLSKSDFLFVLLRRRHQPPDGEQTAWTRRRRDLQAHRIDWTKMGANRARVDLFADRGCARIAASGVHLLRSATLASKKPQEIEQTSLTRRAAGTFAIRTAARNGGDALSVDELEWWKSGRWMDIGFHPNPSP
jgi:hypothetical protein